MTVSTKVVKVVVVEEGPGCTEVMTLVTVAVEAVLILVA
jgi:hypothetical protein